MVKTRIAVFVSGGGTNLQAILNAQTNGIITSGEVVLVVSNRADAFALQRAKNHGIMTVVIDKEKSATQDDFDSYLKQLLDEHKIELIVLAGFMRILSKKFTSSYEKRIINVHPALIPSFCGAGMYGLKVHQAALDYGVKLTGATVHYVNEIPDGGEIISQKSVAVEANDTAETLQKRVMEEAEWEIFPQGVEFVSAELQKRRSLYEHL